MEPQPHNERVDSHTVHILILGTRGIPAEHGGFETFAEDLSLFLKARNHQVTVYCQGPNEGRIREDEWKGVRRIIIPSGDGAVATIWFDYRSVRHAAREKGVILTLGYNTAVLNARYRLRGKPAVMNMDGVEWKRTKWSRTARGWLWFNELAGALVSNHLIADHPEIARHLERHTSPSKITTIPYGANAILTAPIEPILQYGVTPGNYYLVIARPEPENSILEIVEAYSRRQRGAHLLVLGNYNPDKSPYHKAVMNAANNNVKFVGAIYTPRVVESLRFYAKAYIHGHRVGGTNPSLVQSLAAGNAVIAHDNEFTRWVAGKSARYFDSTETLEGILEDLEANPDLLPEMRKGSRNRHEADFQQEKVLLAYESLLLRMNR